MSGSWLLAAVVTALWLAVYGVTQMFADPPLPTAATLLIGVIGTVLLIIGYPSALRGPRIGTGHARGLRLPRLLHRPTTGGPRAPEASRGPQAPAPPPPPRTRAWRGRMLRPQRPGPVAALADLSRGLPLRRGLNQEAADRTVRLLRPLLGGDAVAITDHQQVLAFVGPGRDHHQPDHAPLTSATSKVLSSGRTMTIRHRADLGCPDPHCPLQSAVIAPLVIGRRTVGALKVYRVDQVPPPRETIEGMASILSLHLELAELDRERQLAVDAKLDALRAQINPHFLFNTLNTIASKARTDPEEARQLLLRLSDFFRYSIKQEGHFADFGQEYFFVRTYVSLEQARYAERLRARYDVDPQVLGVQVPVLVIQPLVENAIKHGLAAKVGGGTVTLRARVDPLARMTRVTVRDDGVGMDSATLERVRAGGGHDGGVGLRNINERLATLFGERYAMDVRSAPGEGTTIDLRIPLR